MASRVTYPKRGFIEFKRSTLFPFRKITIASKKYQPGGKHGARAVRNPVTSVIVNINNTKKNRNKYKGCAQKSREAPLVFQVWGSVCCLMDPPTHTESLWSCFQPQVPKLGSTSKPMELSGCAAWSLHFGLCHAALLEFKWEFLPPSFYLWALACIRNCHGFARNSCRIME